MNAFPSGPQSRVVIFLDTCRALTAHVALAQIGIEPVVATLPHLGGPDSPAPYVRALQAACDVLVLALGFQEGASLEIVREVHRQNARFRTVLFTGSSTATVETTTPLFDYMQSAHSPGLSGVLARAVAETAPRRLSPGAAERQIASLIQAEY